MNKNAKLQKLKDEVEHICAGETYAYTTKFQAVAQYNKEVEQYNKLYSEYEETVKTRFNTLTERL